jgi:hypothetical protein
MRRVDFRGHSLHVSQELNTNRCFVSLLTRLEYSIVILINFSTEVPEGSNVDPLMLQLVLGKSAWVISESVGAAR